MRDVSKIQKLIETFNAFPAYREIAQSLQSIIDAADDDKTRIEILRTSLLSKLNNPENETIIIYNTLLVLADISPCNDTDPITLEVIPTENKVVVSTGHQFDLPELIRYHNTRDLRKDVDIGNRICMLNPITNLPFSKIDRCHIQSSARAKNYVINKRSENIRLLSAFFDDGADDLRFRSAYRSFNEMNRASFIYNAILCASIAILLKFVYDVSMALITPEQDTCGNNADYFFFILKCIADHAPLKSVILYASMRFYSGRVLDNIISLWRAPDRDEGILNTRMLALD